MFSCFWSQCVHMCVYISGLTHTILYQSSHLTAALVAQRQSADVTVIVWVGVCVLTKPSFRTCKNIWTGPTCCSAACFDELLLHSPRRRRRRKATMMEGRKRLRKRERSSCKYERVASGEQVSLPLIHLRAATVAPTLTACPTRTPTQGSRGSDG